MELAISSTVNVKCVFNNRPVEIINTRLCDRQLNVEIEEQEHQRQVNHIMMPNGHGQTSMLMICELAYYRDRLKSMLQVWKFDPAVAYHFCLNLPAASCNL